MNIIDIFQNFVKQSGLNKKMICNKVIIIRDNLLIVIATTSVCILKKVITSTNILDKKVFTSSIYTATVSISQFLQKERQK